MRTPGVAPEETTELLLDITDAEAVAALSFDRLDGLVDNAGIGISAPLEDLPLDELRRQLEVNVVGQLAVTQAVLPALRAAKGRIVIMGSIGGRSALPFLGGYAMTKHALEAMADSLRVELAPDGIAVSIVEPGTIATAIWTKPQPLADRVSDRYRDADRPLPPGRRRAVEQGGAGRIGRRCRRARADRAAPEDAIRRRPRREDPRHDRAAARPPARPRLPTRVARRVRPAYDHGCMRGQMMDFQLTLPHLLRRAETYFGDKEVVTRLPDRSFHRYGYRDLARRSKQLAVALAGLGLERGDRVATLCWNHYQHMECYLGIPVRRVHAPHAQPPSPPERPRVHRLPRGRPRRRRRPCARAAARPVPRRDPDRARLRGRGLVRGAARRRLGRRLARSRAGRERGGGDVLHERHDRASEGRRLLASLDDAAHARSRVGQPARHRHLGGRRDPAGRPDVPRERLGLPVPGDDDRLEDRLPRPASRRGVAARRLRRGGRDLGGGGADDLDGDPRAAGREPRPLGPFADERDAGRRLGGAARDDRRVQAAARPGDRPRLGDDGDLAGRLRGSAPRRPRRGGRRDEVRLHRVAGPAAAARRAARARRRGQRDPMGRRDHGRARGARAVGRRLVLRDAGAGRPLDRRRLVPDRRHRLTASARSHPHPGSLEGRDQVGRRVDLVRRARERADGPSRDRGGGGDRGAEREVGRAAACRVRAARGTDRNGGRAARVPGRRLRQVVAPGRLRVRRRDPEDGGREVPEDGAARAVLSPLRGCAGHRARRSRPAETAQQPSAEPAAS